MSSLISSNISQTLSVSGTFVSNYCTVLGTSTNMGVWRLAEVKKIKKQKNSDEISHPIYSEGSYFWVPNFWVSVLFWALNWIPKGDRKPFALRYTKKKNFAESRLILSVSSGWGTGGRRAEETGSWGERSSPSAVCRAPCCPSGRPYRSLSPSSLSSPLSPLCYFSLYSTAQWRINMLAAIDSIDFNYSTYPLTIKMYPSFMAR